MAQAQLQPQLRTRRKRTWRKRRPGDPRHYSVTIGGIGWWQPSKTLRKLGYHNERCGPDGPDARAIAEEINREANVKKAAVDAALVSMDYARSDPNAIYPYEMICAWSVGNAKCLQREFERDGVPPQVQTLQTRLQTQPAPWWHKWLRR
jgi:hypothetical protein